MGFKYNAVGLQPGLTRMPAPPNFYDCVIKTVYETDKDGRELKSKKNGYPMVSIRCEIEDDAHPEWLGTSFFHWVTFMPKEVKGAGMALAFLKAIGEPWEGEFDVAPQNWVDKKFRAKLVVEKDLKGVDRNTIAYLVHDDNPVQPKIEAKSPSVDDECPF